MNRRTPMLEIDLSSWAEFDTNALAAKQRQTFSARRRAVELYVANTAIATIEQRTGVNRRQLYRLIARCLAVHADGTAFGWRALVPHARIDRYQRVAQLVLQPDGSDAAGAFATLLQAHPSLVEWITQQVRAKAIALEQRTTDHGLRVNLRGLKRVHEDFQRQCRRLGLTATDYPFNTDRMAIRSLSRALRAEILRKFGRSAHLAGATHLKGMPSEDAVPAALQVLDVVEFDGHRWT